MTARAIQRTNSSISADISTKTAAKARATQQNKTTRL
jgi:hypothetical protein